MRFGWTMTMAAGLTLLLGGTALAHISVSGPGTANAMHEASFGVGHGCEGSDTISVKVTIPAGVTSVRPLPDAAFGQATVQKDATGAITSVTWTKASIVPDGDTQYYKLSIRMRLPDAPFTTLYFPTTQTCRDAAGVERVTEWASTEANHSEQGPEPAPALFILPARKTGWNKLTVPSALTDLSVFDDAQIVWAGDAAYSSNESTKALIASEGAGALTQIAAGTEIWVKY